MISTPASRRKAARTKRANAAGKGNSFNMIAQAGERAFTNGQPKSSNPFKPGSGDHDTWEFGWESMEEDSK